MGEWMSSTFQKMTFLNGVVAISAGLVGQIAVSAADHPVAAFDVSIVALIACGVIVWSSWTENYGERNTNVNASFSNAWNVLMMSNKVYLVGMVQSCFEAAMY